MDNNNKLVLELFRTLLLEIMEDVDNEEGYQNLLDNNHLTDDDITIFFATVLK